MGSLSAHQSQLRVPRGHRFDGCAPAQVEPAPGDVQGVLRQKEPGAGLGGWETGPQQPAPGGIDLSCGDPEGLGLSHVTPATKLGPRVRNWAAMASNMAHEVDC